MQLDIDMEPTFRFEHIIICRVRNNWVSGFPGHPKIVTENQILEQGLSDGWTTLYLFFFFLTGNRETAREIQILRQFFQTETQILIVISIPAHDIHIRAWGIYDIGQNKIHSVFYRTCE